MLLSGSGQKRQKKNILSAAALDLFGFADGLIDVFIWAFS